MSKRMVDTFFPACLDRINHNPILSFVYHNVLFPDHIAENCPEYVWNINGQWSIRQPCLLLAALWGVRVGFSSYSSLRYRKPEWAMALLTFGIMNASAVFLHCLWPAPLINYPVDYPVFWVVDTYMTGVSGSYLFIASLKELQHRLVQSKKNPPSLLLSNLPIVPISMFIQLVGVLCIVWFVLDPMPQLATASHPLELWYLVPPVAAGVPVLLVLYEYLWTLCHAASCTLFSYPQRDHNDDKEDDDDDNDLLKSNPLTLSGGQTVFGLGIVVASILGLAMDRIWCPLVGYSLTRDLLSANSLVFLGCDLAFWGISSCLLWKQSNSTPTRKKSA